jgi:ERCC4 domain
MARHLLADAEDRPGGQSRRQDPPSASAGGERSPLPWTPGSATRSASPPKAQRPCERPCPPAEDGTPLAVVERKSLENLAATLSDGTLAFQTQRLSELPFAAVVVEGRYSALFKLEHVSGAWLADQLSRLEVRYPEVRVVFADSQGLAEDWTHQFLSSAFADAEGSSEQ